MRNVYRPRPEYWVEVISNKLDASVTYAVTSCDPSFPPAFSTTCSPTTRAGSA
ncbi:hypothetical protein ACFY8W_01190 [Streptomyces sp. NPDC012637]|uniref:hypothetical protein n=1 Tax=Streptomyces sp. NPDC012637 TaxID=3364842 RepID=UPI0036E0E762